MGRLRKKQKANDYLKNSSYFFDFDEKIFSEEFFLYKKIHLEIGFGKGDFIFQKASKNSQINFFGIEKYESLIMTAIKKGEQNFSLNHKNLRLSCFNADKLFFYFQNQAIFEKIYLNFPDPWPKKRHYKRRLIYRDFLLIYFQLLKKDGEIEFKTDQIDLYNFCLEESRYLSEKFIIVAKTADLYSEKNKIFANFKKYQSEYEKRFLQKKQNICALILKKS